jgi:hypothetical protein
MVRDAEPTHTNLSVEAINEPSIDDVYFLCKALYRSKLQFNFYLLIALTVQYT